MDVLIISGIDRIGSIDVKRAGPCAELYELGGDHHGQLATGLPATFVVLDFFQPHLRSTRHLPASVVTRVTPEDVLATYRLGRELHRAPRFEPS